MSKKNFKQIKKLNSLFDRLKVGKNDSIVLHSNFAGIYQYEKSFDNKLYEKFLNFLLKRIGKKGTILIPTYNYDFTKGKIFNREKSKSNVGSFGNYLIKQYSKNRTFEPIFSHIVFGKLKKNILNSDTNECFGKKSVFAEMEKKNFKIVCFCCSASTMTFLHFVEKKMNVKYRFDKSFEGYIKNKKNKKKVFLKYYVGKKETNYRLNEEQILKIIDKNNFIVTNYGRFACSSAKAKYLVKKLKIKINNKNNYLIDKKN